MSLVNIESVQRQVLQLLAKTETPAGIELSSYKRNRFLAVSMLPDHQVLIRESGYVEQELQVNFSELPRLLKTLIKREFPRSRKVRVHRYTDQVELNRSRKTL